MFGWGNSEYNQLGLSNGIQQINTPVKLNINKRCGKIIDIATAGSACMVLNGIKLILIINYYEFFYSKKSHHVN